MASPEPSEIGQEPVSGTRFSWMRAQVGDVTLRRYARAYLGLLPGRLDRIAQAVSAGEAADTEQLIVDLRISSEMLGTWRLAAILIALESSLHAGVMPSTEELARVRAEARLAAEMVRAAIDDAPPA
jgi:hypothetical protein